MPGGFVRGVVVFHIPGAADHHGAVFIQRPSGGVGWFGILARGGRLRGNRGNIGFVAAFHLRASILVAAADNAAVGTCVPILVFLDRFPLRRSAAVKDHGESGAVPEAIGTKRGEAGTDRD